MLDATPLAAALDLVIAEPGAAGEGSEHVTFYATPTEYERHREVIEGLRARTATLQVKLLPDGPLPLLAPQAATGAGINLLQGTYAPRSSLGTKVREWRLPAALAAATALLFVTTQAVSFWQSSRAEKALDAQIAEIFAQALPGQPVVDVRAQMQGALASRGAAGAGLLPVVSVLAQAIAQAPSARIEAMSFRGNALELRLDGAHGRIARRHQAGDEPRRDHGGTPVRDAARRRGRRPLPGPGRAGMNDQLRDWLAGLAPRERNLVYAAGGLVIIALLYFVLVLPITTMAAKRAARVEQKTADLAWMRQVAPQVTAAAAAGGAAGSGESLVVLVDRTGREAGLGGALRDQSPSGDQGLRLRLEAASVRRAGRLAREPAAAAWRQGRSGDDRCDGDPGPRQRQPDADSWRDGGSLSARRLPRRYRPNVAGG